MRAEIRAPSNNGLERTRRVGVPASRAVIKSLALPLNAVLDTLLQHEA